MHVNNRMRAVALALATAVTVPAVGLVTTASADTGTETAYRGKTIASVNVRKLPTTAAKNLGTVKKGANITIMCKVKGPNVDGNRLWYVYDPPGKLEWGWSAARYIKNVGAIPRYCSMGHPDGRVVAKPAVKVRTSPSLSAKTAGTIKYGTKIHTICKVNGPRVDGNPRWYQLFDGNWVPARWVENIHHIVPDSCT